MRAQCKRNKNLVCNNHTTSITVFLMQALLRLKSVYQIWTSISFLQFSYVRKATNVMFMYRAWRKLLEPFFIEIITSETLNQNLSYKILTSINFLKHSKNSFFNTLKNFAPCCTKNKRQFSGNKNSS